MSERENDANAVEGRDVVVDLNTLSLAHAARGGVATAAVPLPDSRRSLPDPEWWRSYALSVGQTAMGYAWVAAHDGQLQGEGVGASRAAQDGGAGWGLDTRINLASVSKSVTAVALLTLVRDGKVALDDPFVPILAPYLGAQPNPALGVVTLRDLLRMRSGMVPDGTLNGNLWDFLNTYLQQGLAGTPGETYAYSNTNFTILQAVITIVGRAPYDYYVIDTVLLPMGIDTSVFNARPDPADTATLAYSGKFDEQHGQYWPAFSFVAPGGWVSSARELMKFLLGIRAHAVLPPPLTEEMFAQELGWYIFNGAYGQYFHHNGGLGNAADPPQVINTGIVRFTDGWDAVLLVNSDAQETIPLMVRAFEEGPRLAVP